MSRQYEVKVAVPDGKGLAPDALVSYPAAEQRKRRSIKKEQSRKITPHADIVKVGIFFVVAKMGNTKEKRRGGIRDDANVNIWLTRKELLDSIKAIKNRLSKKELKNLDKN